ncbi:MAG: elongation factor P [Candidatus Abyssobacteria bacterium SURF_17]|jgi:elongation factor P|uniref:Elongation factor P n=1 Tax=Candidatus Abyssobacteria bacterium SURF_17 TaxID=2093361 RepID=A0A419F077_9BACT|nr:MAG: elongation factor P [Candidatus Abyssubacteria bacterium SURF_17]
MIAARQMRNGMIILYNKELYRVADITHLTPGNLRALVQARLLNLKNNNSYDVRFRADESVEPVMLDRKVMEFLYDTGDIYVFMDTTTYEQTEIPVGILGEAVKYLLPNTQLKVEFYNGAPVGIELPLTVDLAIVETDPPMKGATASGSSKIAKLETGLVVKVPQFLQIGDVVRIDTRDNSFVERAKK